ncbi:MAG: hypothetical protein AAFN09_09510 [Pseudomonadota bacterium]
MKTHPMKTHLSILALTLSVSAAKADIGTALDLCFDPELDLEGKVLGFVDAGWDVSLDMTVADVALSHALLLSGLQPDAPDDWASSQERSVEIATNLRERRGYDTVTLVVNEAEAVVIEPNRSGLLTCLYVGPPSEMAAVAEVLEGGALSRIATEGPRTEMRGSPDFGTLQAHAITQEAAESFPEPLSFATTFTAISNRRRQ